MIIRIFVFLHFYRYSLHIQTGNRTNNPRNSDIGKKKHLLICLNKENSFWGVSTSPTFKMVIKVWS